MARSYDLGLARSSWVACKHGLVWQPVVSHEEKGPGCLPQPGVSRDGVKQGAPLHLWTRLTEWSVAVGTGGSAELGGL